MASLLMLVLGAILGVLESLTNTEHNTSQRIDDEQSARVTLAQLERDVRGAAALMVQGPAPSSTTMDLQLADGPDQVAWVFDLTGAHTLTRSENGNITAVLADVVSGGFSYSDATGQSSSWLTPGDIARSATIGAGRGGGRKPSAHGATVALGRGRGPQPVGGGLHMTGRCRRCRRHNSGIADGGARCRACADRALTGGPGAGARRSHRLTPQPGRRRPLWPRRRRAWPTPSTTSPTADPTPAPSLTRSPTHEGFNWVAHAIDNNTYTVNSEGTANNVSRTVTEKVFRWPFAMFSAKGLTLTDSLAPDAIRVRDGDSGQAFIGSNEGISLGSAAGSGQVFFSPLGTCAGCSNPVGQPGPYGPDGPYGGPQPATVPDDASPCPPSGGARRRWMATSRRCSTRVRTCATHRKGSRSPATCRARPARW